ncbi:MAG: hypothetical protein KatS3mg076_0223 [Candidatus Binatia bacterium]|nr:MAG: hypothetical protein KatS3mg076_0223 [Candidatus Binatia bacterium]
MPVVLAAVLLPACAWRPGGSRGLPPALSVEHFSPNRCSLSVDFPCREDRECPPGESCVSALVTEADVEMRDGGHSALVGEKILWVFGDTISSDRTLRSATAAWSALGSPWKLEEEVDERNRPRQFFPFTSTELEFNERTLPSCCEEQEGCPPGDPYCRCPPRTDCRVRIALWPGDVVDRGDGSAFCLYEKLFVGAAYYDYRRVYTGVAVARSGRTVAERLRAGDGTPLVLFRGDEPRFLHATAVGETVYVWGSANREGCVVDVFLGRVPRARLAEREAFEFWNGHGWVPEVAEASPVLTRAQGGLGSVVWSDALRRFVAAYADLCTGGNKVLLRFSPKPEGPWSEPLVLDLAPFGASPDAYYALLHSALSRSGFLVLSYFDFAGPEKGQIRLLRLDPGARARS